MTKAVKKPAAKKPAAKVVAKKPAKPAAKQGATKKPAKLPVAFLRKLVAALERPDAAQQCGALHDQLAQLGSPRDGIAATALLAETRKGTPIARAFLTALATDGATPEADVVVKHCAALERGRKLMFGPFAMVWRKASDLSALDGAYANFTKAIVDDPDLLAVGVEVAKRSGNATTLADRTARLERATRLAPLLDDLSSAAKAPARERATKQLAALAAADRAHVHARVIDAPRAYAEPLAIAAVLACADDPRIGDMAIAGAIADMHYHGEEELTAAWQPRVAAGDAALITRLLGLFEWVSLWATDDDQLAPYIHALWPAGGRPDVFPHVEHAMASANEVVRAAICEEWLREPEGQKSFDDRQIDKLVRSAVAIAEGGDNTDDRRGANRALFYMAHPGARHALMDAIRHADTKHNDDLRRNCYNGLTNIELPEVTAFFIDRLFVEREEYWGLLEEFSARMNAATHQLALRTFQQRAADPDAIHAVTAYADLLVHKKPMPRQLVELGRAILAWKPPTNDDARRLRHVFEEATLASFSINSPDDARAFVARANALPDKPYSDYLVVDRDTKTPAHFTDADVKKQLAALESGKLDKAIADARAQAAAARAAGTPIALDDARLGALAGCTVTSRFLDDRERKVVWFYDEAGELHVYDGYAVVPMTLEVAGVGATEIGYNNEMAEFVAGTTVIDERVLLMHPKDKTSTAWREVFRLGAKLLVFESGADKPVGLSFGSTAAARDAFARFAANPPAELAVVDPYYREGAGAIRREYYTPLAKGAYNSNGTTRVATTGRELTGYFDPDVPPLPLKHASPEAAIAAWRAWEGVVFAAGGRLQKVWIDKDTTRREDTVLAAFFDDRYRTDGKGAAWHARAFVEMMDAVDEAGLRALVPDIVAQAGPPATDAEIAAYQATVPNPIPAVLAEVWREVGSAGFTSKAHSARLLPPTEVVAKRAELRASLRTWATKHLKGRRQKDTLAQAEICDVIAVSDGSPAILYDTTHDNDDERWFTNPGGGWWEKALGWNIAVELTTLLKDELLHRLGDAYRLKLGQRASDATRRARLSKGDKEYEAIVDGTVTVTRALTPKSPGKPSVKTHASPEAATKFFDAAIAAAKSKGFK